MTVYGTKTVKGFQLIQWCRSCVQVQLLLLRKGIIQHVFVFACKMCYCNM